MLKHPLPMRRSPRLQTAASTRGPSETSVLSTMVLRPTLLLLPVPLALRQQARGFSVQARRACLSIGDRGGGNHAMS